MTRTHHITILLLLLLTCLPASAQRFFNLTSDQVSVDSVMPAFAYSMSLPDDFRDSVYTATILYPEFIDMSELDVSNYRRLSNEPLPQLPHVSQSVVMNRKHAFLRMGFCPLVYRDGKYRILVSFMLRVDAAPRAALKNKAQRTDAALKNKAKRTDAALKNKAQRIKNTELSPSSSVSAARGGKTPNVLVANHKSQISNLKSQSHRYASHSVLASGTWAKIRVPSSGVYELTPALIRQAGFNDMSRVRVYGYGGNLQNEVLNADELTETDDLHEVQTYMINGRRVFYAKGPVSWSSNDAERRTRNPYSDYGYYLMTQTADSATVSTDSTEFLNSFYPSAMDYHSLYEVDGYSWYPGGRNLFDTEAIRQGRSKTVVLRHPAGAAKGRFSVCITAGVATTADVSINGNVVGSQRVALGEYDKGRESRRVYEAEVSESGADTIRITVTSGGPMRLDYVSAAWDKAFPQPTIDASLPKPEYVYNITNQDHHADPQADMVIIIPTSQRLLKQAQRLAAFHEQHDSMRVNIVPADELYNEFSSGTPDANAYRRYMKMLYDRAQTDADMPKYLLLFGNGLWDNRMLTPECRDLNPDNYLLTYESENSFNEIYCYVDDCFFTYLDDGEGTNIYTGDRGSKMDMSDVAVGRFPVTTEAEAEAVVTKTINYVENKNAGAWQNTLMFMGDDGNNNIHMRDANDAATDIAARHPGYRIRKVFWDAYAETKTSTGNSYPDVTNILKSQQKQGALIMDYCGHGSAAQVAHEKVLTLNDFKEFKNTNLPLWIFAACDIMAFDGIEENIGVSAVTNSDGGAIAVFGTTRTVYENYNTIINMSYLKHVLSTKNGKPVTIGEAQRLAKNEMITLGSGGDVTVNKLQYTLLGDPAVALKQPSGTVVIDSINGSKASDPVTVNAGYIAHITGHIRGNGNNGVDNTFNGVTTLQIFDSSELVRCRGNSSAEVEDSVYTFYNQDKAVYNGNDSVKNGRFDVSFIVPFDLNYDGRTALINAFALNDDTGATAQGASEALILGGRDAAKTDTIGPKVFCYLNSPDFADGGNVNVSPYFVAQLSDDSGINATGNGIGHDLELVIDGDAARTYNLNDNFNYDFGSYTEGSTYYNIPTLEPGEHTLLFRAWDTMNNGTTQRLKFNAVKALKPEVYSVDVTRNPASTTTTFIVSHNFGGSNVDVTIDVFDMSGRLLWRHSENGAQAGGTYTVDWNLTQDNGQRLQTGVYLYRVRLASDGSAEASKAKKLIVINNN